MDRFWSTFQSRVSIEETAEESSEKFGGETTTEAAVVPDGYELMQVQQPDGTVVAVRRKLATWQLAHRDSLTSSRPDSSTPSFRTVISRTSDGKFARVQRPVQDVSTTPGGSSQPRQARSAAKRASSSSSVLSGKPARDTMRSTMTIVEDALAEQLSNAPVRHSGRDGSAITTTSGTAISGTSGDIHIGHIEELDEYDNDSDHASSDYDADCFSEYGQNMDAANRNANRKSAAIWPVVFAAVVAQCLKTWFLVKADRWNSTFGQVAQPGKLSQRLQAMCFLVFLIWCLSPLGSQALERACGLVTTTRQTSTYVWYVDRTGYNPMWSANSTLTMSAADRSELVQTVSEKYIGSLAPSMVLSDKTRRNTADSLTAAMLSDSNESISGSKDDSDSTSSLLSLRDSNGTKSMDSAVDSTVETSSFSLITSSFVFTCDNWNLTSRHFDNTTFRPTNMSYSGSQTLGMSMSNSDSSTMGMNTVKFASLNKIIDANGTTLVSRGVNSTLLHNEIWEYSSIQCGFEQVFYSKPMQCERDQITGNRSCTQSAQESLILSSPGLSSTELGDFAQEFVSANLPTAEKEATATEKYIENGGLVDPIFLTTKRDNAALLNLSATVTPKDFERNFGQLFNTWVSLGYCPQCTSDILSGNNTLIPANLQPFYRQVNATTLGVGGQVFVVNWAWLSVFLTFAAVLLTVAVASVVIEAIVTTRSGAGGRASGEAGEEEGKRYRRGQAVHSQLPEKTCSTGVTSWQQSPQWARDVVHDMEAATGHVEHI
ncbi:hypothetical protein N0V82_003396 [Gnomoniopsis sp. IMI 355080]|nr:hypothetical protein N0V82_003396 [Gnomoniopsis sp. IMI 355080]